MNVEGKRVVLTGKYESTKKELKEKLEGLGAKVTAKISGSTDLIFIGSKTSKTMRAHNRDEAKRHSIPHHNESDLKELLAQGNSASEADASSVPAVAEEDREQSDALAGKTVVVTGKFAIMKRSGVHELLEAVGANVGKSVSKNTDILIYGDGAGSKLDKAFKYGVEVMSELEMVELLERDPRLIERVPDARAVIEAEEAKQDAMMPHVFKIVDPVRTRQRERWGATLDELLLAYVQVLSQRPDLVVTTTRRRRKSGRWQLNRWTLMRDALPAEVLALFYKFGGLQFAYVFEEHASTASRFSEGYQGGHLNLMGINNFRWHEMDDWQKNDPGIEPFAGAGLFDYLQSEGYSDLAYKPKEKSSQAMVVFDDSNDVSRHVVGTVEEYLTQGARQGFVWYWPKTGYWEAEQFRDRLFERAIPRDTPREVVEQKLVERGLDEAMARAMYAWLGPDTVILVHED